jgi:hypothetical protein
MVREDECPDPGHDEKVTLYGFPAPLSFKLLATQRTHQRSFLFPSECSSTSVAEIRPRLATTVQSIRGIGLELLHLGCSKRLSLD